jgi:hypothetical protein
MFVLNKMYKEYWIKFDTLLWTHLKKQTWLWTESNLHIDTYVQKVIPYSNFALEQTQYTDQKGPDICLLGQVNLICRLSSRVTNKYGVDGSILF